MNANYRYRGAHIELRKPGIYFNVFDLDFTSLYPTSIIKFNICPSTLNTQYFACNRIDKSIIDVNEPEPEFTFPLYIFKSTLNEIIQEEPFLIVNNFEELRKFLKSENLILVPNPSGISYFFDKSRRGVLPEIILEIFKRRLEERKLLKETQNQVHHYRQLALKIMMNSMYGIFGNRSFYLSCIPVAESITAAGRISIRNAISQVQDRFIYSHTDSIFVRALTDDVEKEAKEVQNELNLKVNEYLEQNFNAIDDFKIELKQEFIFKSFVIKEINRYFAITTGGEDEIKGIEVINSSVPLIVKDFFIKYFRLISTPGIDVVSESIKFYFNYIAEKERWSILDLAHKMKISSSESAEKYMSLVEMSKEIAEKNSKLEAFLSIYDETLPIHYKGALFASVLGIDPPYIGEKIMWFYTTLLKEENKNLKLPLNLHEINPEVGNQVWNILRFGKKTQIQNLRNIHALTVKEEDADAIKIVEKYIDRDKYCEIISKKVIDILKSLGYISDNNIDTVEDLYESKLTLTLF